MKTNSIEAYKNGSFYEIYMQRAFGIYNNSKPDFNGSIIQNLYMIESGDTSFEKFHGSFSKQLEQAKKHMHKAMDKYLSIKKIKQENIKSLLILKSQIDRACSTDDLMKIVRETIELTQDVK